MRRLALFALVVASFFFASPAHAAICESGVLRDTAGGTPTGTCTLTGGSSGADVTCTNGQLTSSGGTNVGTCALSQNADGALLRDGVFGCNANKYANVGSLAAIGGVYVPVNDAAVTLNTGYLVYKECVLDGVIAKISEAARTDLTSTVLRDINEGRNGRPRWLRKPYEERLVEPSDKVVRLAVNENYVSSMCPVFRNDVRRDYLIQYLATKNKPNSTFACSYTGADQEAALRGDVGSGDVLESIRQLSLPGNNALTAELLYQEAVDSSRATAMYLREKQLEIGNGFFDISEDEDNPFTETVITPGYLVSQGAQQVYTSGFRCLEGADELSEVCAPMFSAMIPESFNNGLYNMTRSQSGLASYVSRMVAEASAAVRQEAVNAALSILLTTRQFEFAFKQAKEASANILTSAINRLRTVERSCWELIIPRVCGSTFASSTRTCTASDGVELRVATSTQFSQAVIDANLASIVRSVAAELEASTATLLELDRLIVDVTNASSAANQRAALSRLDQMVAPNVRLPDCSPQKTLHSAGDVQCANKQRDDLNTAVGILVENTVRDWGDSTDPQVGWCNVNNPSTIERWINAWRI